MESGGDSTNWPFSQWRQTAVTSRMLISGIEVGGKGLAVGAGVGVDDVDLFHHIQVLLGGQGGVDVGHARIEAGTEQGHDAGLLEALLIGPLPGVFKMGGIQRLVVGGVQVVDTGLQAGIHDVRSW